MAAESLFVSGEEMNGFLLPANLLRTLECRAHFLVLRRLQRDERRSLEPPLV